MKSDFWNDLHQSWKWPCFIMSDSDKHGDKKQ